MTSIEKTTITIGKAATVTVFIVSFVVTTLGVYYAAMNGIRDGFEKYNDRLNEMENKNNLRFQALEIHDSHLDNKLIDINNTVNNAVSTYLSEGNKPDEGKRTSYDNRRN